MNEVADHDIAAVLRRHTDPDDAARTLVDAAKSNGGSDNITVVVVDVVDDDDRALKASARVTPSARSKDDGPAPAPVGAGASSPATPKAQPSQARRFTVRTALFVVVLLAVLAGALAAIGFYARGSYYVGADGPDVVIYQGRVGGLLWFKPTVKQRTGLHLAEVPEPYKTAIAKGKDESSLSDARTYVANVSSAAQATTTSTTTTTTTATTAPPQP